MRIHSKRLARSSSEKGKVGEQRFFVVEPRHSADTYFAARDEARITWKRRACKTYGTLVEGQETPLAVRDLPRVLDDFVWTWMYDLLAQEHVKELFREEAVSGCRFVPAVFSRSDLTECRLYETVVTGFAGFAKIDRGVVVTNRCDDCESYSFRFSSPIGQLFDVNKWDGTDIFRVWPLAMIFCSNRVKEIADRNMFSGVRFIPVEEYGAADSTSSLGLPSKWLTPEAMARLHTDKDYQRTIRRPANR